MPPQSQVSRRNFLSIIGGGTIVAAGVGATVFMSTRTPHKAIAPWELAGQYDDPRKNALSFALLAPNPHNRQPWEVDLSEPDVVTIYRDKTRNLPETDPFGRQLTIGMGCFIELMTMAAKQEGYGVDLTLFPEGEDGPVARALFREGHTQPDPLFAHLMDRRSCKEPFEMRAVENNKIQELSALAKIISAEENVEQLRQLTLGAWTAEANTHRTLKESVDLFRIGKSEINANPDGIDLGGPFFESMSLLGMLSREDQLSTNSLSFKEGAKIYTDMLLSTPAYAALTTMGNGRIDQIETGRRWLRLNLTTTSLGLSLHPTSQSLQEFPEMAEHYATAHKLLAKEGETVQMLGRLGYGPQTARTPRWRLETRIRNG